MKSFEDDAPWLSGCVPEPFLLFSDSIICTSSSSFIGFSGFEGGKGILETSTTSGGFGLEILFLKPSFSKKKN